MRWRPHRESPHLELRKNELWSQGDSQSDQRSDFERMRKRNRNRLLISQGSIRSNEGSVREERDEDKLWPSGTWNRVVFVIFSPTIILLHTLMPNIKKKPDMSKVLLSSLLIIVFSFGFCYLIYKLEYILILSFDLKVHFIGMINGVFFSLPYIFC